MSGTAMQQQMYINFTRANEAEADRLGIITLSQAGYDPKGMADFFERINRINRPAGEAPPEFLRTHPVTTNRIAEAKARAAAMPTPETGDGLDFYLAQARLRALFEEQPEQAVAWFRDRLEGQLERRRSFVHAASCLVSGPSRARQSPRRELGRASRIRTSTNRPINSAPPSKFTTRLFSVRPRTCARFFRE